MRLDDLYTQKNSLHRQKSDDYLRKYVPKIDSKPYESPLHTKDKHKSPEEKWTYNRKLDVDTRFKALPNRPVASSKDNKKESLLSTCRS